MNFFNIRMGSDAKLESTFQERCKKALAKERKQTNKRIIIVGVVWALIIGYMVSPLSKARVVSVSGNVMLDNNDLESIANLSAKEFLWSLNKETIEENLAKYDYIESASVNVGAFGVKVDLEEISVVAKSNKTCDTYGECECTYYLSNGNEIVGYKDYRANNVKHIAKFGDIPYIENLSSFNSNQTLILFKELGYTNKEVRNIIISLKKNSTTSSVVDVELKGNELDLENNLILQVDISTLSDKLTMKNLKYLANMIKKQDDPSKKDGKYCYIYRSADYLLPCND